MRRWLLLAGMLLSILVTATPAQADTIIYLPHIDLGGVTPTGQSHDFTVEWVRLWSIWENGGTPSPFTCGTGHTLQVDIFDLQGEGSTQPDSVNGRLNGITVMVTHRAADGTITTETQATGAGDNDDGVVQVPLLQDATVQISTDAEGKPVESPPVNVSTTIAAIPMEMLINAGYCTDEASCQPLIDADQCKGTFSWGVVFKRRY